MRTAATHGRSMIWKEQSNVLHRTGGEGLEHQARDDEDDRDRGMCDRMSGALDLPVREKGFKVLG